MRLCTLCNVGMMAAVVALADAGVRAMSDESQKPATAPASPAQPAESKPAPAKPADTAPASDQTKAGAEEAPAKVDPYVLGFTMKSIDGEDVNLESYKGKVLLIVNVASKCGMTPQYEGLQKLFDEKKDAGLVVLGFPANNFGNQEPGSDEQIKTFCTTEYNVTFPMFAKISVKNDKTNGAAHPLYQRLAAQPAPLGGEPEWNFTKYLVDRQGNVVEKFAFRTPPSDATLRRRIDELLAAK